MNRNEERFLFPDSTKRILPDWLLDLEKQKQEFLDAGGKIEQIPFGASGYQDNYLAKRLRATPSSKQEDEKP